MIQLHLQFLSPAPTFWSNSRKRQKYSLTIWAISCFAMRNSKNAHNKSQPTNKYGMNGLAWRMRKFDAYRMSGFSWYKSPEYGFILFSYRNAPSWTEKWFKKKGQIQLNQRLILYLNLTSFPWIQRCGNFNSIPNRFGKIRCNQKAPNNAG